MKFLKAIYVGSNQVTDDNGNIIYSRLPQDIRTTAGPTFDRITLSGYNGLAIGNRIGYGTHSSPISNLAQLVGQSLIGLGSPNVAKSKPVLNVQYFDGSTWQAWATTDYKNILDDILTNRWNVPYANKNFRFTIDLEDSWVRASGFLVWWDWGGSNPIYDILIESSTDNSNWTSRVNETGVSQSINFFKGVDSGADRYVRVTFNSNIITGQTFSLVTFGIYTNRCLSYKERFTVDYDGIGNIYGGLKIGGNQFVDSSRNIYAQNIQGSSLAVADYVSADNVYATLHGAHYSSDESQGITADIDPWSISQLIVKDGIIVGTT